ncbi:MAG: 4Fe-4S binding protein [Chloroflexota bacterium]
MTPQAGGIEPPRIAEQKCQVCEMCQAQKACRTKAMRSIDPGEAPFIDLARCQGCRICMPACPLGAVVV